MKRVLPYDAVLTDVLGESIRKLVRTTKGEGGAMFPIVFGASPLISPKRKYTGFPSAPLAGWSKLCLWCANPIKSSES
jgi:hypothetical protein